MELLRALAEYCRILRHRARDNARYVQALRDFRPMRAIQDFLARHDIRLNELWQVIRESGKATGIAREWAERHRTTYV